MFSPFEHVGGILNVLSRAFPPLLAIFSVDREESRWSQEAQKEPENDVALLLPQKKIPNMPMDMDSEGEGKASYVEKRE